MSRCVPQAESEALLLETKEAGHIELNLTGISDLRPLLAAVRAGQVLPPIHLAAVAATIDAAEALQNCLAKAEVGLVLGRLPKLEPPAPPNSRGFANWGLTSLDEGTPVCTCVY
jgi:hypothetical protein